MSPSGLVSAHTSRVCIANGETLQRLRCSYGVVYQTNNTLNPVPQNCQIERWKLHGGGKNPRQSNHLASWHYTCFIPAVPFAASTGVSEVNMADGTRKDWRELCVAVTNESDSSKLSSLVQELIEALDQGERSWRQPIPTSGADPARRHC